MKKVLQPRALVWTDDGCIMAILQPQFVFKA